MENIYTYSGRNLTKVETNKDGSNPGRKTYNHYDDYDRMISVKMDPPQSGDSVTVAEYTYDSLGRRLTATDADGLVTSYMYDILGRLAWIQEPGKTTKTCYSYDALGRKIEERAAASSSCAVVTNQTAVTSYAYDGLGRLVAVADPGTNTTDYEYDAAGNITAVADARDNETLYSYNLLSQLTSTTNAMNKTTSYIYDSAGRLAEKDDAKGQAIIYTYDDNNYLAYLEKIEYKSGSTTTEKKRTFVRDNSGQVLDYCDSGLITNSDCLSGGTADAVYRYRYDALGRRKNVINLYLNNAGLYNNNVVMTYKYDQFGNRTALDVVEGSTTLYDFAYDYDGAGRIAQIADGILSGATIRIEFYDSGRMKKIRHLNGSWTDFSYSETTGQLTEVAHMKSGPTSIIDFQYQYNARNDIMQKEIDGIDTDYYYDAKNQLTQVNIDNSETELYTYDGVGNRTRDYTYTGWTYNNVNQLLEYDSYTFTYDDNGNMITYQNGNKTLEYSVDDRLMKYKESTVTKGEYKYDVDGLRVAKLADGSTTFFLYDGTVLLAEVTKDGSTVTDERYYTFMPGSYYSLAMVVFESGTPHGYDIHNDHLMTPQVLTSAAGSMVWQASYKAFGEVNITTNTVRNSIRFPGQYQDQESGFYYNHYRYFLPIMGIFNSIDIYYSEINPLFFDYEYAFNNPLRHFDLFGLSPSCCLGCDSDNILLRIFNVQRSIIYIKSKIDPMDVANAKSMGKVKCLLIYHLNIPLEYSYPENMPRPPDECVIGCYKFHEFVHVLQCISNDWKIGYFERELEAYNRELACLFGWINKCGF